MSYKSGDRVIVNSGVVRDVGGVVCSKSSRTQVLTVKLDNGPTVHVMPYECKPGETSPEGKVAHVIAWARTLTDQQREELIDALGEVFCTECGTLYTPQRPICYCTRDD
jgi:hypothetical protein